MQMEEKIYKSMGRSGLHISHRSWSSCNRNRCGKRSAFTDQRSQTVSEQK